MKLLKDMLFYLGTPDNQGRDWYGWASNQLSHAFIGAFIAILCTAFGIGHGLELAACAVSVKKLADFVRVPTWATVKDAWHDAAFWIAGALLVDNMHDSVMVGLVSVVGVGLLLIGTVERIAYARKHDLNNF